ncbi:shikimate dehydrogenase [Thermospira aquatica]|uniref:Shikimate dehydrogenase (NADP(+)) n=1 Tax=Thermospira aquatica TaxID=2828656 RepID=A0AAX3BAJ0_9SPIR|nr:shikimate dehydrogenase [Thermospira aquatica]URA09292.1 shikimate dehydrogenase [Thermospira aquatica]
MIDASTRLFGILGHPVRHSFSPAIHNAAFQACGINAVYLAFDVESLEDAIKGIRALHISGASVTLPHKIAVMSYLDDVSDLAQKIGSVNTLFWEDGKLKGENTDAYGFYESLSQHTVITDTHVVVLGSGGASLAVCFALFAYDRPAKLTIVARNQESRNNLRLRLLEAFPFAQIETANFESVKDVMKDAQILINTTPVGMFPHEDQSPIEEACIPRGITVMDLIYHPVETTLLKLARAKHCVVINGAEMLLFQAMRQFEIWTGEKAPFEVMQKALQKCLKQN